MIQRLVVKLEADTSFEVEVVGADTAVQALIMVHGFGVKRDSRGMFEEIEKEFSDKHLCVRAEFSEVYDDYRRAIPLSVQAQRLERVVQYVQDTFTPKTLVFIGHSQGCIVVSKNHPKKSKVVLLAPPIIDPAERFAQTSGWSKPGSRLDRAGESQLVRSDGSVTKVGAEYWTDFQAINPAELYQQLSQDNDVTIIFAGDDSVLGHQPAVEGIKAETIVGAGHDFKDSSRQELLQKLHKIL